MLQCDISPQQAGSMPLLSQLPLRHQARTLSQPPKLKNGSTGQLAAGMSLTGVPMGPSLPPPVPRASPPAAHGWAAQPGELAPRESDAESIAGSTGEDSRRRWPSLAVGPRTCLPVGPPRCHSDSESSSQHESASTRKHDPRRCSRKPHSQRCSGQFGPQGAMFVPPGIPTFQYPQQPVQARSSGVKSKTDLPIHTSPSHPPTSGSAKRQAMEMGQTPSVHAEHHRRAQELSLGKPPCSTFAMTLPMSMVLGYRQPASVGC